MVLHFSIFPFFVNKSNYIKKWITEERHIFNYFHLLLIIKSVRTKFRDIMISNHIIPKINKRLKALCDSLRIQKKWRMKNFKYPYYFMK